MNKKYIIATLMLAFFGISGTSAQYVWNLAGMPAYDIELEVEYYTDLLETTDNSAWLATNNDQTASVWLGRTLQPDSYNTLALPFSMAIPDGWDVKELASSSFKSTTGELTLNFSDANTIEAGKPYLVKISGSEAITLTGYDDVIIGNAIPNTTTDAVNFIPTLGKTLVTGPTGDDESNPEAVLYLGANNKLHHPTVVNISTDEASYIKGFRAYFQLKEGAAAGARAYSINLGDGSTGVSSLTPDPSPKGVGSGYYSLDGRKLNGQPTVKGVYIKNGKKIVIK
jgi:hypothetical protein